MTFQLSFSKQEQEIRSRFREKMDKAESMEDVKKFFYQTVRDLILLQSCGYTVKLLS